MKRLFCLVPALLAMAVGALGPSCRDPAPPDTVSIGSTTSEVNSLLLVAREKGYFTANGIALDQRIYPSGVAAVAGMSAGEVDIATGSEFAFAGEVFAGNDIRAIASISRSSIEYLVARTDRGIAALADLKGKKIGLAMGSRPEFALDRFLLFHGIDPSIASLVNVPVSKSVEALANGEVDAVAVWQPYIDRIEDRLGADGVVSWDIQEDQPSYTLVMCNQDWAEQNPSLAGRFLRSLVQAENFVAANPAEAQYLVRQALDYDAAYIDSVWGDYNFSVSLNQALIVAMEDEARWMIEHGSAGEGQLPDFTNYISEEALKKIKPEAVYIIR